MTPRLFAPLRRLLLAGVLFFSGAFISPAMTNSAWSVHVWQSDDGLPNNDVMSIAQTRDGYLWVTTPTRLARFDGVQFEAMSREFFMRKVSQRTSRLLQSRAGGLWLAVDHGPII